jgi:hypothetical protein
MSLGALSPCPFRVGGGPSPTERAYRTMRRAVGKGGSAENDLGIDGLWRRSRAAGVAAATSSSERALLQAWPHLATDALDYYARATGLVQGADETEAAFRDRVWVAWTTQLQVDCPTLAHELQRVDPRAVLVEQTMSVTTQHGRAIAPLWPAGETPAWGLPTDASEWPNYATSLIAYVRLALGYAGAPSIGDQRILERLRELLSGSLPSWVDFQVLTETSFLVDSSPVGTSGVTDP